MAKRDRELLKAAGLSIVAAAKLFDKKRQSIHHGLLHSPRYFSGQDAAILFNDAKGRDWERIADLVKYIEVHFGPEIKFKKKHRWQKSKGAEKPEYELDHRDVMLPNRAGLRQLQEISKKSDQLILAFNDNLDHVAETAVFGQALREFLKRDVTKLDFVLPAPWMRAYLSETMRSPNYEFSMPKNIVIFDAMGLPFLLARKRNSFRGFVFTPLAVEEIHSAEAQKLWQQLNRAGVTVRDQEQQNFSGRKIRP